MSAETIICLVLTFNISVGIVAISLGGRHTIADLLHELRRNRELKRRLAKLYRSGGTITSNTNKQ